MAGRGKKAGAPGAKQDEKGGKAKKKALRSPVLPKDLSLVSEASANRASTQRARASRAIEGVRVWETLPEEPSAPVPAEPYEGPRIQMPPRRPKPSEKTAVGLTLVTSQSDPAGERTAGNGAAPDLVEERAAVSAKDASPKDAPEVELQARSLSKAARKAKKREELERKRTRRLQKKVRDKLRKKKKLLAGEDAKLVYPDKDRDLSYERLMPRDDAVAYFEALLDSLREGRLKFRQEDRRLTIELPEECTVQLKAKRKNDKESVSFAFSWPRRSRKAKSDKAKSDKTKSGKIKSDRTKSGKIMSDGEKAGKTEKPAEN